MIYSKYIIDKCELIVVNDGSTDRTSEIAHIYEKKYKNITVIDKSNGGHGSGINAGVRIARGKYFKIVDADDWVVTENLENFIKKILLEDTDIVAHYQNNVYEDANKEVVKKVKDIDIGRHYYMEEIPPETLLGLSNVCFKTEKYRINNIKIDEECFYVDIEYILYPLKYMKDFIVYDDVVYCYRLGNSNQSINTYSMYKNRYDHFKVINNLLTFYQQSMEAEIGDNIILYMENVISDLIKAHYYLYFLNKIDYSDIVDLKEFDVLIKQYLGLYNKSGESKSIRFVRKTNFHAFRLVMSIYRRVSAKKNG